MNPTLKVGLGMLAVTLTSFGVTYQANPKMELLGYAAAIALSIGSYLAGLFQDKPGGQS